MSFAIVKSDYHRLIKKHGHPYDMTGGFVDAEKMEYVILNPTKKNAEDYMRQVISYGFQFKAKSYRTEEGFVDIDECPLVKYIYVTYIKPYYE